MGDLVVFPYEYGEGIDLTNIDQLSDEQLFKYEEEISNMIICGINEDEMDFLEKGRNELMDEIKRRYFEMKEGKFKG